MRNVMFVAGIMTTLLTGLASFAGPRDTGGGSLGRLPESVHFAYQCEMSFVEGDLVFQIPFTYSERSGGGTGHLKLSSTAKMWRSQVPGKTPRLAVGHEFRIGRMDATLTMAIGRDSTVTYTDSSGVEFNNSSQPTKDRLVMYLEQRNGTGDSSTTNVLSVVCDKK